MSDSKTYIENSIMQSGGITPRRAANTPIQYANRYKQYYAERNKAFVAVRAKYATDYVQAQVQGIDDEDFYRYFTTNIRLADMTSFSASSTAKNKDDVKVILFDEPSIDYFPIGAKVKTMGSTWICTNPSNLSDVQTTAVIQRCNAAYCLYDYYGNIVTEPIVVEKATMTSNDNKVSESIVLVEGYFNIIAQKNEYTEFLGLNQRIILGRYAYFITGFTDFIQEFTGDYDSIHLYRFSARIEEPQTTDDIENHIANGKNYSFEVVITGQPYMPTEWDDSVLSTSLDVSNDTGELSATYPSENYSGTTFNLKGSALLANLVKMRAKNINLVDGKVVVTVAPNAIRLTAHFLKNGEEVESTAENPVTWEWASSDVEIATVTQEGVVTGISVGAVTITATMVQNTALTAAYTVTVEEDAQSYVEFMSVVPALIEQYETATIQAAYFDGDAETDEPITWSFSGASSKNYSVSTDSNNVNAIQITCLKPSKKPLVVTASYDEYSASREIQLLGY